MVDGYVSSSGRAGTTASSSRSRRELAEYEVDDEATAAERQRIRARAASAGSRRTPEQIASRYRGGELDVLDLIRQYGVILDWGTGELLPKTTAQYREMLQRRMVAAWLPVTGGAA